MNNKLIELIIHLIGLLMLVTILFALPLQILWNWLMPTIFDLPYITFWQAFGLNLLAGILFRTNINVKK